ncbi:MAG: relaxase domain-containing protein [Verrucomicrobiales bacterium]|nr:relaxase domain-containing protein [Verrucomicrobiales bacterium]
MQQFPGLHLVYGTHKPRRHLGHASVPVVTVQTQYNLANARSYFAEHLAVGDYYSEGESVRGEWIGLGARGLGMTGPVHEEAFLRLCENQHPSTGETLTQRLNSVRRREDRSVANRRIFFDFTFSPPKSVSLAAFLGRDDRIVAAHDRAVRVAFAEFETFAAVRVRRSATNAWRRSGNLVGALFRHETSRALDPHLHTHAVVFNASWDPVEKRWKALENRDLLNARLFARNVYYHTLARSLREFGYGIVHRARGDFEIAGIPEPLCARFSKRHAQIDEAYRRLLSVKPELTGVDVGALRRRLATAERSRKQQDIGPSRLRELWEAQLAQEDRRALDDSRHSPLAGRLAPSLPEAVAWAEEHLLDRCAVVPEHRLWQEALGRGRGGDFGVAELRAYTTARGYVRSEDAITTPEVLRRECEILRIARDGCRTFAPLVRDPAPFDARLDAEQRAALEGLLGSTDRITVFRGGAGTGKSFVLRSLVDQVTASGRPVVVLAPQRQQVVDLRKAGLPNVATVAAFLTGQELPERALIVVDEAGQIGGRQMLDLLHRAVGSRARVVLSGDTRQHGPVEASDALRALERDAGVTTVSLQRIRRQDPDRGRNPEERRTIAKYRHAVELAARGDMAGSFRCLESLGAVVECPQGDQAERIAREYLHCVREGTSPLVVSQTWAEVHHINARVREHLKAAGLLGTDERSVEALVRIDLTTAQKRDARYYPDDAVLVFNRKVRKAGPGTTGKLAALLPDAVLVDTGGSFVRVPWRQLDRINVCTPRPVPLAAGDILQLKANRPLASGAKATNGERVTVRAVEPDGSIRLEDGRVLGRDYREFLPGYAVTSYGSQGKTVDHVLISDSGSKAATNAQQWYVSISRGRRGLRIFTPDKAALRENIGASGDRPLAVDLVPCPPWTRWHRVRAGLRRFGRQAVLRLKALRFLRPKDPHRHHELPHDRRLGV